MIRVHRTIYRTLWVTVAALGAILLASPLMLIDPNVTAHDPEAFRTTVVFGALAGAAVLAYAIRRLIKPLTAPPRE